MATDQLKDLVKAARYMGSEALVWGSAGNASIRQGGSVWISGSGTMVGRLALSQLVKCPLEGEPSKVALRPSKELPMHQTIYQERNDVTCVLHASPFYATLIACSDESPRFNLFVESMYYLYDVRTVGYIHPGSQRLAEAVRVHATSTNVIFLKNHGVLVYDLSVKEALVRLETVELACKMWVTAKASGVHLDFVSQDQVTDFIYNSGYKSTLPRGASK